MNLQQRLVLLGAIKYMQDRLAELEELEKAALKADVGGRMAGAAGVLPDGTEGCTVSITKPTPVPAKPGGLPYVSNPQLFTEWVEQHHPDAIVKSVRATDIPHILGGALKNGEVPPGCELTVEEPATQKGGGVVQVRQSKAQKQNISRALMAGAIPLPSLAPQLEAPDGAQ